MEIPVVLSGVAVGAAIGFVLQRGRLCVNTAFRNAFYTRDFTLLRAYVLALVITIVAAHLLDFAGIIHLKASVQQFTWLANIFGGYLFGIGMVLAGGDAAGAWYRAGEGLVGSWFAVLGIMIGASATSHGALSGIAADIESFVLSTAAGNPLTLDETLGANKWVVIALVTAAGLTFLFRAKTSYSSVHTGYRWKTAGTVMGLLIVLGLIFEELTARTTQGVTFVTPSDVLLSSMISKTGWDWGTAMVAGVPLGSLISAAEMREFSWRSPRAVVLVQQFAGGLIMGIGGMLAGGCSIGHGLTGIAVLALSSLASMFFIILGSFTMVYILFMRRS